MFVVIRAPLKIEFQEQEDRAQDHGQNQIHHLLGFLLARLRRVNRQRHRQAAADQHRGVDGAEFHVEQAAADFERGQVQRAINDVSGEQPAEEHDFGDQENPHAQAAGFALLLHVLELMFEPRRMRARARPSQTRDPPTFA